MSTLNPKRLRLLELLARHQDATRFPLVRDLARELGLAGESSLTRMLDALATDGFLEKQGGGRERHRRIFTLTSKGETVLGERAAPGRLKLPVVGLVTAGPLREAVQEAGRAVEPGEMLRARRGDFFLEVDGDSMVGDGILPGDLVLLRPGITISSGEIAAVQVRQNDERYESTLKRVFFGPKRAKVVLRASNPAYADMEAPADAVEVVGAFRGLVRPCR